jgi:pimeloyl-ACP methyl ester carboxylesterase
MPLPSILLVHGPATGAWLWETWRRELTGSGWQVIVLDLRGHGLSTPADLASITMQDYLADVTFVASQVEASQGAHPVLGGWSTGALIAMMYAAQHATPPALLLMSPSQPLEVAGRAPIDVVRQASGETLGPDVFGVYPGDPVATRAAQPDLTDGEVTRLLQRIAGERESGIAYRQVLRGISVAAGSVRCPSLILHTSEEAEHAALLKAHLQAETLVVPGAGRWGIVCHDPAVAEAAVGVDAWLRRSIGDQVHPEGEEES